MDTTIQAPRGRPASAASTATNTSAAADSPVWSSGSGAIKEIRLHEAESQVRILEAENKKRKEHEEFYINKAREWKNRALKYERTLEKNGISVPNRYDKSNPAAASRNDTTDKENSSQAGNVEDASKDFSRNTTKEMNAPGTPEDSINIVLTQKQA